MKRIWKYVWKNIKRRSWSSYYGDAPPVGKVHKLSKYDNFQCGSSRYEGWTDEKYKELPQKALDLGREAFCRKCFPDIIIYPDMSLPDELFRL